MFWPVPFVPSVVIFSDASANGCAAFIQGIDLVFQRNWSLDESEKSSTWRELAAIKFSIEAFGTRLFKQRVRWQVGRMVRELQDLALSVFPFYRSVSNSIRLFGYLAVRMLRPIFSVK